MRAKNFKMTFKTFIYLVLPISAMQLPFYLDSHLNKSSPNYTTELNPWNSSKAELKVKSTIKLVTGFFRHGNRAPGESYNNDKYPFNDKRYWPDGPKELTKVGKNQLYELGKTLRKRYEGFLNKKYIPQEVVVKSNILPRNYMSAACLLAGLFPPEDNQLWSSEIKWQPIPIWSQPIDITKVTTNPNICPNFYQRMLKALHSFNLYQFQHQSLLDFLNEHTGLNVTELSDIYRFWEIFNLQADHGYALPKWLEPVYHKELRNIHATSMATLTSATPQMIKLLSGPLVSEIHQQIREKIAGNMVKLHLESVRETTINALLPVFGFMKPFIVYPGAMLIIELHENKTDYFVEFIYYKNATEKLPEKLLIEDCKGPCPLKYLFEIFERFMPHNWKEECKVDNF